MSDYGYDEGGRSGGRSGAPDDYVDVASRIAQFREQYPEGVLRPADPHRPFEIVTLDDAAVMAWLSAEEAKLRDRHSGSTLERRLAALRQPRQFVVYTAAAYRHPDDPCPGIGVAWEPLPGLTPYTHNSEVMNAETSAWGRAIVAVGAADAKASAEEVRNRSAERAADDAPVDMTSIPVPVAKAEVLRVAGGNADTAKAVWEMQHLPSGKAERITFEDFTEAVRVAVSIVEGHEPFEVDQPDPGPASEHVTEVEADIEHRVDDAKAARDFLRDWVGAMKKAELLGYLADQGLDPPTAPEGEKVTMGQIRDLVYTTAVAEHEAAQQQALPIEEAGDGIS